MNPFPQLARLPKLRCCSASYFVFLSLATIMAFDWNGMWSPHPTSWLLDLPLRFLSSCMISRFCSISNCTLVVKPWILCSMIATRGVLWHTLSKNEVSYPSTPMLGSCWATINLVLTMLTLGSEGHPRFPIDGTNWWCFGPRSALTPIRWSHCWPRSLTNWTLHNTER